MLKLSPFEGLRQKQAAEQNERLPMSEVIKNWERTSQRALEQLAQILWPPQYVLGLIPVKSYRLRSQQVDPRTYVWWVERDILPYYERKCATYQVHLFLVTPNQPKLAVQSGKSVYLVTPLTEDALEAAVAQAGYDPPLIIPRLMGRVEALQ